MGLKGNLSTVNLADVFQVLSRGNSTGLLRIIAPEGPRFVEIQNGAISIAGRSSGRIMLGDLLLSRGLITEQQLDQALQAQRESGKMLGQALLDLNVVQMPDLEEALRFQIEEEVCELFLLGKGDFDFLANATLDAKIAPAGGMVRLKLDPNGLLLEAARRADDWKSIEELVKSQSEVFQLSAKGIDAVKTGEGLSGEGLMLLRLANDHRSIEAMVQKACLGRLLTNQMIIELTQAGLLEPLPKSAYEKTAREHLKLGRLEEAQRLAQYMIEALDMKDKGQALLVEIEKAKKASPQTSTATVAADPRVRSEVIKRKQPGLILKKDKSPLPWIIGAAVLLLAAVGGAFFFMYEGSKGGITPSRKSLDEVAVRTNDLIVEGKYTDALELLRTFRSKEPDVQRLANDLYEKKQKEIEAKQMAAMERFNNAVAAGKPEDIKTAADLLETLIHVNIDSPQMETQRARTMAAYTAYKEKQSSEEFRVKLKEIKAAEAKGGVDLLEAYKKLLLEGPPETVAVQIRDEISRMTKGRADAQARLKRAEISRNVGDFESARMELEQAQRAAPGSEVAAKAAELLNGLGKAQSEAQSRLERIEILLTQKRNDEAKGELVKFLDARPPVVLTVRAMDVLHKLTTDNDAQTANAVREIAAIADKQPGEARKKLDGLLKSFPYAKPAVPLTLKVAINSQPEGAELLINGRPIGRTPLSADVPVIGQVRFTFKRPGFAPYDLVDYNFRQESLQVHLDRLPVGGRRMPIVAQDGVAVFGDHCIAAGGGEAVICGLPDYKIQSRLRLVDPKAAAQSGTPSELQFWRGAAIAHGQALISRADKSLFRVDLLSGQMSRLTLEEAATSAPVAFTSQQLPGKRLLGLATAHGLETYNFEDSKPIKRVALGEEIKKTVLGIAFDGDRFYLPREGKALKAIVGWSGEKKWEVAADAELAGPITYSHGKGALGALTGSGAVLILDVETGAKRGMRDTPAEGATGILASGDGFAVAYKGKVDVVGIDGKTIWSSSIAGAPVLPPLLIKSGEKDPERAILVCHSDSDDHYVSALNPIRGGLIWRARLTSKPLSVATDGTVVIVATDDAELTTFDFK